ncbi:MAG: phosphoadenylyl-sulfate reductase [bacterium]|nr:phosphoadenylyl-sulfate reductase [bacterium]
MALDAQTEDVIHTLKMAESRFAPAAFANSLGAEDMVLTDLIARHAPGIEIFTLDTGRLNPETYALLDEVRRKYGIGIRVLFPESEAVEEFVNRHGPNAFYESAGLRKTCCFIRKVAPLGRALEGKTSWITGLRQEQAPTRGSIAVQEWDDAHQLHKFNPLAGWTHDEVWAYIRENDVPYNGLHDQGYPSIGCAPCTRPIAEGEDIRAGRWWWEDPHSKECGLHPASASRKTENLTAP